MSGIQSMVSKFELRLELYLLWNNGLEINTEIGDRFNATDSAVNHSVKVFEKRQIGIDKPKNFLNDLIHNSSFDTMVPSLKRRVVHNW